MKSKEVNTITNNGDSVRLRIFEGELPADEAYQELLRIEKVQHDATRVTLFQAYEKIISLCDKIEELENERNRTNSV
jgi:hypothetical protein